MKTLGLGLLFVLIVLVVAACDDGTQYRQATCALVDGSGTYADQRKQVFATLRQGLIPRLLPGDSLIVLRIDGGSYEKANVVGVVTLDQRPSRANAQKLAFANRLKEAERGLKRSRYTDIQGAMMLCSEYLREVGAGRKTMIAFSDLKEELPKGSRRALEDNELQQVRVVAMNVKKLAADNRDPSAYRRRLRHWEKVVRAKGASDWRVVMEPEALLAYLDAGR